jgi:restriction system protein
LGEDLSKNFGAIERTSRGVWTLTPKGYLLDAQSTKEIPSAVRQKQRQLAEGEPAQLDPALAHDVSEEIAADWKSALLSVLNDLSPSAFERLSQRLLRESGFIKVEVTGRSGDGGIDGIGVLRINLISFQVLFQCKKYKGTVGAGAIRDFRGAMVGRSDKGLVITTGRFTPDALREATRDGAPPIELIDGLELCALLKQLGIGVRTRMVESVELDREMLKAI